MKFLTLPFQKLSDSLKAIIITSNIWNMNSKRFPRHFGAANSRLYPPAMPDCVRHLCSSSASICPSFWGGKKREKIYKSDLYLPVLCLHSAFSIPIMIKKNEYYHAWDFFKWMPFKSRHSFSSLYFPKQLSYRKKGNCSVFSHKWIMRDIYQKYLS